MHGTVVGSRLLDGCHPAAAALLGTLIESGLAHPDPRGPLVLEATPQALRLVCTERGGPGSLQLDLSGPAALRRWKTSRSDPLARAIGMRKGPAPRVVDATCGMARDSLALVGLGCRVTAVERHPVVLALLRDALRRAAGSPIGDALAQRFQVVGGDARDHLGSLPPAGRPDVVFLDPMYPGGPRKALPSGATQLLQRLVSPGPAEEEEALLRAARAASGSRVVVKRPRKSSYLGGVEPRSSHGTRSTRYDVYAATTSPPTDTSG